MLSFSGNRPSNLGVASGRLADVPASPNVVSTQHGNEDQKMSPIEFGKRTAKEMIDEIERVVDSMPRTTIIEKSETYLYVEFRSLIFRFVDDVEFYASESDQCVHFRSASRVGYSDMGANRSRMEKVIRLLNDRN